MLSNSQLWLFRIFTITRWTRSVTFLASFNWHSHNRSMMQSRFRNFRFTVKFRLPLPYR
jgi:hypothetical protein